MMKRHSSRLAYDAYRIFIALFDGLCYNNEVQS